MRIREATAGDAPALARLRWEFRSVGRGVPVEDQYGFVRRCTEWMRAALSADGGWKAWVADQNGVVVGQIWVQLFEKLPNPTAEAEWHAYISNLYVTPSARGGVGAQLLEACLEWLAGRDIEWVLLWPSDASRSLYSRYGFEPVQDVLVRSGARS